MPLLLYLPSLPTPLISLLLTSLLPTASAAGAAGTVDTSGFWLGFCLLVVVSAAESAASIIWTRIRVTSDGIHPPELSCRVCGREINATPIDPEQASEIAEGGGGGTCGCFTSHTETDRRGRNAVMDQFGSPSLVPSLLIRRFNPNMSLEAPARLVNNVKELVRSGTERNVVRVLEHVVDLLVSLTDVSLGVAGLALSPGSPQSLYSTLKDPKAPITFQNYTTLFLMYWLLGAVLLLCMIPQRSSRASIQIFGWPGLIAFAVAGLASLVLFGLGCWKIDFARRHHTPWTPMLSYWIGGASAISFPVCGVDAFAVFGTIGLVFMLKDTFN